MSPKLSYQHPLTLTFFERQGRGVPPAGEGGRLSPLHIPDICITLAIGRFSQPLGWEIITQGLYYPCVFSSLHLFSNSSIFVIRLVS